MRTAAHGFQILAAIMITIASVNTALGGSLTSAVTGGASALVSALLAISCSILAHGQRTDDTILCDVRYIHPEHLPTEGDAR